MTDISITVNDLSSVVNVIDVCTQRGAFKAAELEMVGKLYTKLKTFVDEQTKQSEQEEESKNTDKPDPSEGGSK